MSRRFRILSAAIVSAAALLIPAGAALAGTPTPSPSVSPNFGYQPKPVFHNWQFDIQLSNIGAINVDDVEGVGAIPMTAWRDVTISPKLDKFVRGVNSVTVLHPILPFPTVNFRTCTLSFRQVAPFRIVAGTGTAAGAISRNGQYVLNGLLSFPYITKYGHVQVCPLRLVNLFGVIYAVRHNLPLPSILPVPTFSDFAVQGDALVTLPAVTPTPTHSYASVAPVTATGVSTHY